MAEGLVWLEDLLKLLSFGRFKTFAPIEGNISVGIKNNSSPDYINFTRTT